MKLHQDIPTLASMLLSSPDPERLQRWYDQFGSFGSFKILFDKRDEISGPTVEPTRVIMNFHCNDAKAVVARLDVIGVEWISPLEKRENGMYFATTVDPDGNYVQIVQLTDDVMLSNTWSMPFSGFSVNDLDAARRFYADVLGFRVLDLPMGALRIAFAGGNSVLVYPKPNHEPAAFTILNFPVDDLEVEVDKLLALGVTFERYEGFEHDARGIVHGGDKEPDIAWFTDPSGNILSLLSR